MRLDPLQQYAKLHKQLTEEKSQLESRLRQINEVLGGESVSGQVSQSSTSPEPPLQPATRRGRKPKGSNELTMREAVLEALSKGPLARKELVKAVEAVGYVFMSKNPINSIGSILYAKNGPIKNRGGKYFLPEDAATATAATTSSEAGQAPAKKKKRKVSAEARARMSKAQKARWAK